MPDGLEDVTGELAEFRRLVEFLGFSLRSIAAELGTDDRLVRRWQAGKIPVPPEVIAWLRLHEAARHARPAPRRDWYAKPSAEA